MLLNRRTWIDRTWQCFGYKKVLNKKKRNKNKKIKNHNYFVLSARERERHVIAQDKYWDHVFMGSRQQHKHVTSIGKRSFQSYQKFDGRMRNSLKEILRCLFRKTNQKLKLQSTKLRVEKKKAQREGCIECILSSLLLYNSACQLHSKSLWMKKLNEEKLSRAPKSR